MLKGVVILALQVEREEVSDKRCDMKEIAEQEADARDPERRQRIVKDLQLDGCGRLAPRRLRPPRMGMPRRTTPRGQPLGASTSSTAPKKKGRKGGTSIHIVVVFPPHQNPSHGLGYHD